MGCKQQAGKVSEGPKIPNLRCDWTHEGIIKARDSTRPIDKGLPQEGVAQDKIRMRGSL
jgi:hypothetical protein